MINARIPWFCAIRALSEKEQLPRRTAAAEPLTITGMSVDGSQNFLYSDDVKSLKAICSYNNNHHQHQLIVAALLYNQTVKGRVERRERRQGFEQRQLILYTVDMGTFLI